ncbi:MAG: SIMPL domain-containing protein [Candidatus Azobacteroides sp.]|nr:SIMPL domain-containing protein [Candidatus Azobacteroides sp.]
MDKAFKILCIGLLAASLAGCSRSHRPVPQSYVEVVGTAQKEVDPDIFYLSFNLNESNKGKANNINALEQRILVALKTLNIDAKADLSVTGMSGDNWYWWRRKNTVYQNKSYLLKLNNLDLLNKTCDKLDSLNVEYILSKVDYSKMDDVKKQAQQEAVQEARVKAENLLSGEHKKVNNLIYLQEQILDNRPSVRFLYKENKTMDYADKQAEPSPDFKKMKVSYSVIARFSIE